MKKIVVYLFACLFVMGCAHRPSEVEIVQIEPADPQLLMYELDVKLDLSKKILTVSGKVDAGTLQTFFFLNENLLIDEINHEGKNIGFKREGTRITLAHPIKSFSIKYHGQLSRSGTRDYKSQAWIEPSRVRLTEVTLWYPIFYYGTSRLPWPPQPGRARLRLPVLPGLNWATVGLSKGNGQYDIITPSSLVIVAVDAQPELASSRGGPSLRVYSSRGKQLAPKIKKILDIQEMQLGKLEYSQINIVDFPDSGVTNGLAFVSSNLGVFSASTCDYVVKETQRSVQVVAHEMAHFWFGGEMIPVDPGVRWLSEGFAEYYAWRVIKNKYGARSFSQLISEARKKSAGTKLKDSFGWETDKIYEIGPLAIAELAKAVGERHLDQTIKHIHEYKLSWSMEILFAQLAENISKKQKEALAQFRHQWDI